MNSVFQRLLIGLFIIVIYHNAYCFMKVIYAANRMKKACKTYGLSIFKKKNILEENNVLVFFVILQRFTIIIDTHT